LRLLLLGLPWLCRGLWLNLRLLLLGLPLFCRGLRLNLRLLLLGLPWLCRGLWLNLRLLLLGLPWLCWGLRLNLRLLLLGLPLLYRGLRLNLRLLLLLGQRLCLRLRRWLLRLGLLPRLSLLAALRHRCGLLRRLTGIVRCACACSGVGRVSADGRGAVGGGI
jgi:hypothetical protein